MNLFGIPKRTRPWSIIAVAVGLWAMPIATTPAHCAPQVLTVVLDQARLIKLPDRVATLVIGNPLVADATLQPGDIAVLTGKSYGSTNLMALDHSGNVLMQRMLRVKAPQQDVSVYRGMERTTYSCTPKCEPRIMLGDSDKVFTSVLGQAMTRNGQAQSAASQ